ncbi:MFS transporter [Qipengyuania gelatinilytica]|uniref:MFS transporter n=1 Tax=Qipengyuania gelatinilytica TaxID=2867231 RepID=A0ABX9A457_9SPHN|nr:MFS transporter [Qipengyuania gelatinilytica]QZD96051.1 MFS transporter [Qipengyuania gelatinilytica]
MLTSALPVRAILAAIFVLMAGSGFLSTLIAIRLEQDGQSAAIIGLVATSYFAGLMIGSMRVERLIANIGHIRAFAAFVTVYSASSLTYAIIDLPAVWVVLRLIDGFAMAGVFVCLESWLNQQASPANRSSILAAYMIALYCGQAGGQFLLNLGDNAPDLPFMVSAILLSIALLPILLTKMQQPVIEKTVPFSLKKLYKASPLGIVGTLATGAMLGAFYALGAVYVQRIGMPLSQVALFTFCVIAGGVVLQYPLGILSDRFDRRQVVNACFLIVGAICAVMAPVPMPSFGTIVLGSLFGGFAFALYPLCVAHSNDHLSEEERIGASSGLVLTYSLGAVAGPMIGSLGMGLLGPAGLFGVIGTMAIMGAMFGLWRTLARASVPAEEQQAFQSLPRTTPMAAVLESEDLPD